MDVKKVLNLLEVISKKNPQSNKSALQENGFDVYAQLIFYNKFIFYMSDIGEEEKLEYLQKAVEVIQSSLAVPEEYFKELNSEEQKLVVAILENALPAINKKPIKKEDFEREKIRSQYPAEMLYRAVESLRKEDAARVCDFLTGLRNRNFFEWCTSKVARANNDEKFEPLTILDSYNASKNAPVLGHFDLGDMLNGDKKNKERRAARLLQVLAVVTALLVVLVVVAVVVAAIVVPNPVTLSIAGFVAVMCIGVAVTNMTQKSDIPEHKKTWLQREGNWKKRRLIQILIMAVIGASLGSIFGGAAKLSAFSLAINPATLVFCTAAFTLLAGVGVAFALHNSKAMLPRPFKGVPEWYAGMRTYKVKGIRVGLPLSYLITGVKAYVGVKAAMILVAAIAAVPATGGLSLAPMLILGGLIGGSAVVSGLCLSSVAGDVYREAKYWIEKKLGVQFTPVAGIVYWFNKGRDKTSDENLRIVLSTRDMKGVIEGLSTSPKINTTITIFKLLYKQRRAQKALLHG